MKLLIITVIFICILNVCLYAQTSFKEKEEYWRNLFFIPAEANGYGFGEDLLASTVFIAVFVRNKEHSLPYFLHALNNLNYPKDRIAISIVTDHNRDNSVQLLKKWYKDYHSQYHQIHLENPSSQRAYEGQQSDLDWPVERHGHMLTLRQKALEMARRHWADYILYIDADNILMNPDSLWHLIANDVTLVAPALNSTSAYSNFWCGQDERGYYKRTDDYFPIKNREKVGIFPVPMIHSTFLIDLTKKDSSLLQFWPIRDDYELEIDDIIVFSMHTKAVGVTMHVDNKHMYGYLPVPLKTHQTLDEEVEAFMHLLMEVLTEPPVGVGIEVPALNIFEAKPSTKLGFDEVYMINLLRRPDRYYRMKAVLDLQGIAFKHFHAVDSKTLNTSYLIKMGIDMLPGFVDPYHGRTLTRGEIGCFLSHYFIWKEVVEKHYKQVIVLEDDIRFENAFKRSLGNVMEEILELGVEWDLIYIGRKRMQTKVPEKSVEGSRLLVEADYSFWTLGYLLSASGARKLIDGDPLGKMVPVDEYLPIMFNKHPVQKYMDAYSRRNVIALSTEPLLLYPTHYTGQENYFSDTETSSIWEEAGKKEEL